MSLSVANRVYMSSSMRASAGHPQRSFASRRLPQGPTGGLNAPQKVRRGVGVLMALALAAGCDASQRGRDASAPTSQRVAEVSVRIDVANGGAPSVSVLAFRASVTGIGAAEVLGVVDPLVTAAPDRCELRDVAEASRSLKTHGGAVELEELENVAVGVGAAGLSLRPVPRVYPQLASVVGGVIAEAGPVDVTAFPETVNFALPGPDGQTTSLTVPLRELPRLLDDKGGLLSAGARLDPGADLTVTVNGPSKTFLEIRPFGATLSIACPIGSGGRVVVPREQIERLIAASGRVPVAVEAVWRDSRPVGAAGANTRLSVEARSSAVLELRP